MEPNTFSHTSKDFDWRFCRNLRSFELCHSLGKVTSCCVCIQFPTAESASNQIAVPNNNTFLTMNPQSTKVQCSIDGRESESTSEFSEHFNFSI